MSLENRFLQKEDCRHGLSVLVKGSPGKILLDDDMQYYFQPEDGKPAMLCTFELSDIKPVKKIFQENY